MAEMNPLDDNPYLANNGFSNSGPDTSNWDAMRGTVTGGPSLPAGTPRIDGGMTGYPTATPWAGPLSGASGATAPSGSLPSAPGGSRTATQQQGGTTQPTTDLVQQNINRYGGGGFYWQNGVYYKPDGTPAATPAGGAASILSGNPNLGQGYAYDPSGLTRNPTFQQITAAGQQAPSTVPTLDARMAQDAALLNSPFTTNPNFLASMPQQLATQRAGNQSVYDYNAGLTPLQQTVRLYQTLYPNSPEALIPSDQLDTKYDATNGKIPNNVTPNSVLTPQATVSMSGGNGTSPTLPVTPSANSNSFNPGNNNSFSQLIASLLGGNNNYNVATTPLGYTQYQQNGSNMSQQDLLALLAMFNQNSNPTYGLAGLGSGKLF